MGTRYTEISASTNGWLSLEVPITNASPTNNLTSGGTPISLVVLNILGQVCGSLELHKHNTLKLDHLPGGVYTLRVTHGGKVIARRVIKN